MTNLRIRTKPPSRGSLFTQQYPMNGQNLFTKSYYAEQPKTLQTENVSVHRVHFILM